MCKYCKRLEEVRKNERRDFIKIANYWKRRYYKVFSLVKKLNDLLVYDKCDDVHALALIVFKLLNDESEVNDDA